MAGEADIIGGLASGAAAGAAFGPVGAGVGAVLGGIGGLISGGAKKRAARLRARAERLRTRAAILRNYGEQRTALRQAQAQAALVTTAGVQSGVDIESSMVQGIRGSIYNQSVNNYALGSDILNFQLKANQLDAKSAKELNTAATTQDIMGALATGSTLFARDPAPPEVLQEFDLGAIAALRLRPPDRVSN